MFFAGTPCTSAKRAAFSGRPLTKDTSFVFWHFGNAGRIWLAVRPPMPTTAQPTFCPGTSGSRMSGTCAAAGVRAPANGAAAIDAPVACRNRRRGRVGAGVFAMGPDATPDRAPLFHRVIRRRGLLTELGAGVALLDDQRHRQDMADLGRRVHLDAEAGRLGVLAEGDVLALRGLGRERALERVDDRLADQDEA